MKQADWIFYAFHKAYETTQSNAISTSTRALASMFLMRAIKTNPPSIDAEKSAYMSFVKKLKDFNVLRQICKYLQCAIAQKPDDFVLDQETCNHLDWMLTELNNRADELQKQFHLTQC